MPARYKLQLNSFVLLGFQFKQFNPRVRYRNQSHWSSLMGYHCLWEIDHWPGLNIKFCTVCHLGQCDESQKGRKLPPYFKAKLKPAGPRKTIFEARPPSFLRVWMNRHPLTSRTESMTGQGMKCWYQVQVREGKQQLNTQAVQDMLCRKL